MSQVKRKRDESEVVDEDASVRKCPHMSEEKPTENKSEGKEDALETIKSANIMEDTVRNDLCGSDLNDEEDDSADDDATRAANTLKMNGFDVLDDLDPEEDDDETGFEKYSEDDSDSESDWSSDNDVPQEEIEAMLEEG